MNKVEVKNLTKQFGELLVLDNISFNVGDGEFLCIVGPTGCGCACSLRGGVICDNAPYPPGRSGAVFDLRRVSGGGDRALLGVWHRRGGKAAER